MTIDQKVQDYKKMLDLFPNAQEKYQYLIEQAKDNTNFPEELRNDHFKVSGCQSQVWLIPEEKDEKVYFIFILDLFSSNWAVSSRAGNSSLWNSNGFSKLRSGTSN